MSTFLSLPSQETVDLASLKLHFGNDKDTIKLRWTFGTSEPEKENTKTVPKEKLTLDRVIAAIRKAVEAELALEKQPKDVKEPIVTKVEPRKQRERKPTKRMAEYMETKALKKARKE